MNIQVGAANNIVIFATIDTDNAAPTLLARSTDGGKTFSNVPVNQDGHFPLLSAKPGGALNLAFLDFLYRSTDRGQPWELPWESS
jgi:hypothetical protein